MQEQQTLKKHLTGSTEAPVALNKMGTMPVGKLVLTMSMPAMISMLIQAFYNVIDSVFVAQLGEEALAAISLIFPVQMLLVSVGVGTGVGVNSLISRRLGERNFEAANQAATHGFLLSFINWFIFAIFGLFFVEPFIRAFSSNPLVIEYGSQYLSIITVFSLFICIQFNVEKILQATGNMIFPMVCSLIGAALKITLNPILVFGLLGAPRLGVAGAAIATVTGNCLAMIFGLTILFGKTHEVKITLKDFHIQKNTLKNIYAVGLPAIIMQSIGSIMIAGLNGILIKYSEAAVAVLGVYFRLQNFIFMPVFGLTQGTMPIMGYNYGARQKHRLMLTYKISFFAAFTLMALGLIIFQVFPVSFMNLFNASSEMMEIGVRALRIISICFLPAAYGIICSTLFQATGYGILSLLVSLLRQLVLVLPLAWFLSRFWGLDSFWFAFPLAEIFSVLASFLFFRHLYQKEIRDL